MLSFFQKNLIGIDIGSYSLKVVSLKGSKGSYTLEGAACVKLPPGGASALATEPSAISEVIRSERVKGRNCAAILSGPSLIMRHLYLPQMPQKDLKEAVSWEIRKEASIPQNELVADYMISGVRAEENKVSLIAFATRRGESEKAISLFERAGLQLRVLEAVPGALLSAFDMNGEWEEGVSSAMLDIGHTSSMLAIVKDRRLVFARGIDFGGSDITEAVATVLRGSGEEAEDYKIANGLKGGDSRATRAISSSIERLCTDIHRSFDYYQAQFREGPVGKLFISGGTARLKGIEEFVTAIIGVKCFADDPLRKVKLPRGVDASRLAWQAPCLTVAAGLATKVF